MTDRPGIVIPPPLILVAGYFLGVALQRRLGSPGWTFPGHRGVGLGVAVLGLGFAISGAVTFLRRGTAVNPMRPATHVVTAGPYRVSRNPMYLGTTVAYLGFAIAFAELWALVTLPLAVGILQSHVIAREERYLEAKFGDAFREYRARVRRWI
jgi:protein-S-isoprenylcysteine O-methyltransferase Ste14